MQAKRSMNLVRVMLYIMKQKRIAKGDMHMKIRKIFPCLMAVLLMMAAGCGVSSGHTDSQTTSAETNDAFLSSSPEDSLTSSETGTYRQVSPEEAAALMEEEEDYIILDVRTEAEYEESHIPGAICIPNETIGTEEIPELPDKDQLILVYCRSGNRSKQASAKLADLGYTNIVEFGGIIDWPGETVRGAS